MRILLRFPDNREAKRPIKRWSRQRHPRLSACSETRKCPAGRSPGCSSPGPSGGRRRKRERTGSSDLSWDGGTDSTIRSGAWACRGRDPSGEKVGPDVPSTLWAKHDHHLSFSTGKEYGDRKGIHYLKSLKIEYVYLLEVSMLSDISI